MAFCSKCGVEVSEDAKFCQVCGATLETNESTKNTEDFAAKVAAFNDTADTTAEYDEADISSNKIMGVLAYLGFLVLVPIFAAKNSKFARFHSNQGLVLFIAEAIWNIISSILSPLLGIIGGLLGIVNIIFFIIAIIGIVNVLNGKAKELPIIGKFTILK